MLLRLLSYRYKIPLCMIAASSVTAVAAVLVVSWQFYQDGRRNLAAQHQTLGYAMVDMLAQTLNHDDVWHAYRLLSGGDGYGGNGRRALVLFDEEQNVFASNQPLHFPTGAHASELRVDPGASGSWPSTLASGREASEISTDRFTISAIPVVSDNVLLGTLVITDSHSAMSALFNRISLQGFIVILVTVGILAPLGWYWGNAMVQPLLHLESCIKRLGREPIESIQCLLPHNRDEIGRLSQHFKRMLDDLKEKAKLEHRVMVADKLATTGTLAAGVAHEINNPLAGMMIAVDSYKQYCVAPECAQRQQARESIALVERGLTQIRETVATLLTNLTTSNERLKPVDIDDVYKLVLPESKGRAIVLSWENAVDTALPVPATLVRQVLINLLLNAIRSTDNQGRVCCRTAYADRALSISVRNNGASIPEGDFERLFEPHYSTRRQGIGLGLWVTQLIVEKLEGDISVASNSQWTEFVVKLPFAREMAVDENGNSGARA